MIYVNTLVFVSPSPCLALNEFYIYFIYNDNKVHKNSYKLSTDCAINHLSEGETKQRTKKNET